VTETDRVFSFDMDPEQAVRTRHQMNDRSETEDTTVVICHQTGFGELYGLRARVTCKVCDFLGAEGMQGQHLDAVHGAGPIGFTGTTSGCAARGGCA
jgi:hypothetical protein